MSLKEKLKESRRITVEIGNVKFFGRRATEAETLAYHNGDTPNTEVAINHIDGWDGVKECDFLDGGSKELLKFDKEDFADGIADRADWALEIARVVMSTGIERINKRAENAKN